MDLSLVAETGLLARHGKGVVGARDGERIVDEVRLAGERYGSVEVTKMIAAMKYEKAPHGNSSCPAGLRTLSHRATTPLARILVVAVGERAWVVAPPGLGSARTRPRGHGDRAPFGCLAGYLPLQVALAGKRDGARKSVRVRRGAVEDLRRHRLENVERDAGKSHDRIDTGAVGVRTAGHGSRNCGIGSKGGGIGGEGPVPVRDCVRGYRGVRRSRADQDPVLAGCDVAASVLALIEGEPADREMKVEVVVA